MPLQSATSDVARRRSQLAALSLVMLLPSLGTSIANVALPTFAASFGATIPQVQWVVLSYLLAVTTLVMATGRLGDIFGKQRLLLAGTALFVAASIACAIAPTLGVLILARGLQGAGAASMMTLTIALINEVVPNERTGSAMGLLGTISAVGTALGPTLGGGLIAWIGWPAVFALLAGIGAIAFLAIVLVLPRDEKRVSDAGRSVDVAGLGLLGLALAAFTLTVTHHTDTAFARPLLGATTVAAAAAFLWRQSRAREPLIRIGLLRDRGLATELLALWIVSAIIMTTLVVGPFYLSRALLLEPAEIGLIMSTGPIVAALVGVPAGRLVDRTGSFRVAVTGLSGVACGAILMTVLPAAAGVKGYVGAIVVLTAGYALFQAANTTNVMSRATPDARGVTSALIGLTRNLGLICGASVMGGLFALASEHGALSAGSVSADRGMHVAFGVATGLAVLALGVTLWGRVRIKPGA